MFTSLVCAEIDVTACWHWIYSIISPQTQSHLSVLSDVLEPRHQSTTGVTGVPLQGRAKKFLIAWLTTQGACYCLVMRCDLFDVNVETVKLLHLPG